MDSINSLGMPVIGTTATGDWNGAGYGSGYNNAEYLIQQSTSYANIGGSAVDIPITDIANTTSYKDATVHVGLANVFPMRLMMQVDGFIENRASPHIQ